MKQLTVKLAYGAADFGRRLGPEAGLALPVKALDADGSVLGEGAASADRPVSLEIPDDVEFAFVRLMWPSGRSETQRVSFDDGSKATVTFDDDSIASNEWSSWAIPKLNPRTPLALASRDLDLGLDRFDRVWLRLWTFANGDWARAPLRPVFTYRNGAAWQLDLELDSALWLLQLGGSKVVWRFVALPGGGPARVLITPKDSTDPRADALKVIATSFRADAETLLEFLVRDSMRAAGALARSEALAAQLFADKFEDPVSAVAGAYYLLRSGAWQSVPLAWYETLSQRFRWLPDTSVIHCVRLLREGTEAAASRAEELFNQSVDSGWPAFSEGVALLQEAAGSLHGKRSTTTQANLDQVRALGSAKAWAGAAASFYGRLPHTPSILQWVGMPNAPRRRRLDPALSTSPSRRPETGIALKSVKSVRSAVQSDDSELGVTRSIGARSDDEFILGSIKR